MTHFQIHDRVSSVAIGDRSWFVGTVVQISLTGKNGFVYCVLDAVGNGWLRDHDDLTLVLAA